MSEYFDELETRSHVEREADLFKKLPELLTSACAKLPVLKKHLGTIDLASIIDRKTLATLPVLRKPELMELQRKNPPFGGLADPSSLKGNRVFMSPGPVWEPQGMGSDPWQSARALFAAGIRSGDIVHNSMSYHLTPGAFILEEGARALGCLVFPAGVGNTQTQAEAAATLKPSAFTGTPDYLKILLDKANEMDVDLSSIKRAFVSGGALFPSMRQEYLERGVKVLQAYATADLGVIAYESADSDGNPLPGMIINENIIVEIVRPGTNDPVELGEVGEVVVTSLNPSYPLIRFGTGDLSAIMEGASSCGRTNSRIKGWMGRADQRSKIKGMFVDPKQIDQIQKRHSEIGKARLVISRANDNDVMTLEIEPSNGQSPDTDAIASSLADITKLRGSIKIVAANTLPNDGLVIADERDYEK